MTALATPQQMQQRVVSATARVDRLLVRLEAEPHLTPDPTDRHAYDRDQALRRAQIAVLDAWEDYRTRTAEDLSSLTGPYYAGMAAAVAGGR